MRRYGKYVGIPFCYSSNDIKRGLDCRSFISFFYANEFGVYPLKQTLTELKDLKVNCLVVFLIPKSRDLFHLAVYVGGDKILHMTPQGSVISTITKLRKYLKQVWWRDDLDEY